LSIAYPLRSRFRTAVTFAMFTLVVFTVVVGATTTDSFTKAFNNLQSYGGGFDVRATTAPSAPITSMTAALRHSPGINSADFRVVSSQSFPPVSARQVGPGHAAADYVVRGLDPRSLNTRHTPCPRWPTGTARPGRSGGPSACIPGSL
jgi:putative ABC transport system permease protein